MAAVTVNSSYNGEFVGERKIYAADITVAGSADTLDLSSVFKSIDSVQVTFKTAQAATAAYCNPTVSGTTVTFNTQTSIFGGASTNPNLWVVVIGKLN